MRDPSATFRSLAPRMRVYASPGRHCFCLLACVNWGTIVNMPVERPPVPTEERKPAWRRACLAYREIRDAGGSDQQAHEAAVEAVQQVLPQLSRKEASAEAVNAIAYTTKYHSEWFWKGAQSKVAYAQLDALGPLKQSPRGTNGTLPPGPWCCAEGDRH